MKSLLKADILLAASGPALALSVFLVPKSGVVEVMPANCLLTILIISQGSKENRGKSVGNERVNHEEKHKASKHRH